MQMHNAKSRPAGLAGSWRHAAPAAAGPVARRARVVSRAADTQQLTAPRAPEEDPQQQEAGKCPFLAALPSPPPSQAPWFKRLNQLFKPEAYAREALGPHEMVAVPPQMGMPGQYIVGRADWVKTVFSGEADGITTVAPMNLGGANNLLGTENLLVSPEPRHKYLRNLIMPAFTNEAIEKLIPRMEAVLQSHLDRWAGAGAPVKAHEQLRKMTFEFIIAVVLGRDYPQAKLERLSSLFTAWTGGMLAWPFIDLPFTPFGRARAARQQLLDFFQECVCEARSEMAAGRQVSGILGSLVAAVDENSNRLTDSELGDNLLLLMLAGHDTSSTTLTSVMANLQDHPEALQKLRDEQARLSAIHGPRIDGTFLKEMKYADAVIRESLRLKNVVAGLMRTAAKDFEMGGNLVPKGTVMMLPLTYLSLADPRFANDDPRAFRPERMMTPEAQAPGAQLPFGHGPRFCAGYSVAMAEMKVYLALLARHYDFNADTNTTWKQEIGQVPKNGLPMTVARRA